MEPRKSLYHTLQQRVLGVLPPGFLLKRARGSKYLVQCLQKETTLTGHEGCVNSIAWNENGELLLSGADDYKLNIYRPANRKLVHSIRSGHRANIFSAKFLPCSGDRWIVSCAGNGMIHFTDLNRESTYGQFPFDCHAGTTYEVITTPGDPNTFLSCGEDGTVRQFDLRTKTKCLCRECKEDILIDCGKAVTSINLNPIMPYHLGLGCEDSTVRVFDRRALSSSSSNKMHGMFCQFRPESLSERTCRVTSLSYSPDGSELLVSYCADYVYLFTLRGTKQPRTYQDSGSDNGYSNGSNGHRNVPPLKRLRLRGDWSDTGPNARPESEHPSPESSLMQRMSDMFARWLEESFRAGQRHRARTSTSRSTSVSSSSSSVASSPTYLSSSSSESSSASGVFEEEPRRRQIAEPRSETLFSREGLMLRSTVDHSSVELDADPPIIQDVSNRAQRTYGNSTNISSTTSLELIPHSEEGQENPSQTIASASAASDSCSSNGTITLEGDFASSGQQSPLSLTPTSMSVDEARCSRSAPELSSPKRDRPVHLVASSSSVSNQNRPQKRTKNAKKAESVGNVTGVCYNAEELSGGDMYSFSMATPETSHVTRTRAQPTPCQETCSSRNTQEILEVDSSDHERSSAATRIQRVYRLHKKAKISAQSDEQHVWIPEMTRVYKGHRNARTMIIRRNEKMLEESRDTITVPASFMIRMLATLNQARFGTCAIFT
ncbi:PREDICTED: DDB1- and CUL4-associated factor 6-like [Acropora digitifera]|uniref:DDB1- and CUL4-associated factor 6-like n=1 Tax=Acropora digitifera TaxID=70779 RepID=UPI00077B2172|nr:PREDICTED: DDB1- and CUL4-associated factor 6-like [Acropora digitifera]